LINTSIACFNDSGFLYSTSIPLLSIHSLHPGTSLKIRGSERDAASSEL